MQEDPIPKKMLDFARGYFMGRVHSYDNREKPSKAYTKGWYRGADDYEVYDADTAMPHTISNECSL